ncbi:C69 family dipeptidase [Thermococcus thioreducens]|uniref:Dipeptidase n=1 Tax=Thermococcus thioreducens TaxID=277988 RepID=A0A0Q2UQB1_9EURY|nr:C69 family dipeptidase [Thermococcus thioreducens]ASJ13153.1 peptidase U34 [Thermococcus thioreducens]KQH82872.1 peptidase U34 [Thermococcus thioreducens]SEW20169.1 Dipeptidase [Thermococcus thioreducens]
MCDILVATPEATEEGITLFAKNSDREPNEAQILELIPRIRHREEMVRLTYVDFPQVKETYAVILSRPWWMWGAEMGVNEFELAIGNTAVFTKVRVPEKGITGMDMIRLALERTKSAKEALEFITGIVEDGLQGGNGSKSHGLYYFSSFVIADPKEAWVLETVGKEWAAKKIEGVYSISNALTIGNDWDMASEGIEALARNGSFSFAKHFSDRFYTHFARGRERRAFTLAKLKERAGKITLEYMMSLLRSHSSEPYRPEKGSMRDICMHYGGLTRPSQTASSQVSELGKGIHWFTGTSNPCLSIFKPVSLEGGLPDLGKTPMDKYDPETYWWRFEAFHRRFLTNYRSHIEDFARERDRLQAEIIERAREIEKTPEDMRALTEWAFREEAKLLERWEKIVKPGKLPFFFGRSWRKVNEGAGLEL